MAINNERDRMDTFDEEASYKDYGDPSDLVYYTKEMWKGTKSRPVA